MIGGQEGSCDGGAHGEHGGEDGRGGSMAGIVLTLSSLLDEANAVALSTLTADELADALVAFQSLTTKLDAARSRIATHAETILTGRGTGLRSAAQLVGRESNADQRRCRLDVRIGRWLSDFPLFADAFARGDLSVAHLNKLMKVDNNRTRHYLVRDQAMLVESALEVDFVQFDQVLGYWLIAADPDGEEPAERRRDSGCQYRRNSDGSVHGSFRLDPVSGEAFIGALEREAANLFDDEQHSGEHRSRFQRLGDALVNLAIRGSARADGTYPAPLISVVMSEAVAEAVANAMATNETPEQWPTSATDIDGRCEFVNGTPLHPWAAAQLFAVARFRRFVFDPDGAPVDVAATSRRFPALMRHLLRLRSRGRCSEAGCDAPPIWLQDDHVHPVSRGGSTSVDNGQSLCGPHNRLKGDSIGWPDAV